MRSLPIQRPRLLCACRGRGFIGKAVFLSSNTKDFGTANNSRPRDELGTDFDSVKLDFANETGHALHLLGF